MKKNYNRVRKATLCMAAMVSLSFKPSSRNFRNASRVPKPLGKTALVWLMFFTSICTFAQINTWTGATDTNWNTANNWSTKIVPTATDNVVIPNTTTKPTISAGAFCNNLTINNGAILTLANSTISLLKINGNFTNNGTYTSNTLGTTDFSGTDQVIAGGTYGNLTTSGSRSKTLSGPITVNKNLFIGAGTTLIDNEKQITGTASGVFTMQTGGVLFLGKVAEKGSVSTLFPTNFVKANIDLQYGSKVLYNSWVAQTISYVPDYYNVECQYPGNKYTSGAGTLTVNGDFSTASPLDISGGNPMVNVKGDFNLLGTPLAFKSTSGILSVGGSFNNSLASGGSINSNNGTVNFNGTAAQSITGTGIVPTTFYNLIINNTSGGVSIGITGTNKDVTVTNTLTMTRGILTTSNANLLNITNTAVAAITGGSATSFINGPVKWTLPANLTSGLTYIFPIGKEATYLPFLLVDPTTSRTGATPTVQVEAFDSNCGGTANFTIPTVTSTVGSLSTTEYWSLVTTGTFINSKVSLSRPTPINPLDLIAGSTSKDGTAQANFYTSLGGTSSGTNALINSTAIGTNRFFTFGRKNGIRIDDDISSSAFCAGASISVPLKVTGSYPGKSNIFTAQMSDINGNFAEAIDIGFLPLSLSGETTLQSYETISAIIPTGALPGKGYRIRVVSSAPNVIGEDNGSDLTVISKLTLPALITNATCSNGNNGAIATTLDTMPLEFKSSDDDYVNLGSSILNNRTAFTIEGWVKFKAEDVVDRMSLFGQNDVVEFFLNRTTVQLYTAGGGEISMQLPATLSNNQWHHIAATGDGTNLKIYIDGSLVATGGSTTSNYGNSSYPAKIGSGVVDATKGGFTGQIYKTGFYSKALSASTIAGLSTNPTTYLGTESRLLAGLNYNATGNLAILPSGAATLVNTPTRVDSFYTYSWSGPSSYTASSRNISGLAPGQYKLSITGKSCPSLTTYTVGSISTAPSVPAITTITQPNCITSASIVLSGLPASGTIKQAGTATADYPIKATTMTIYGLAAGTYNFTVVNGSCSSPATANVVINPVITNTWNGSSWSTGAAPTVAQTIKFTQSFTSTENLSACACIIESGNVTIKSGRTLALTNQLEVGAGGSFTLEDNAVLLQENKDAVNKGKINVERKVTGLRNEPGKAVDYVYWGSPVEGQQTKGLDGFSPGTPNANFFFYNEANDRFYETGDVTFTPGRGYAVRAETIKNPATGSQYTQYDKTYKFTGKVNNGTIERNIIRSPDNPAGVVHGYNLVGNPYPSNIDFNELYLANCVGSDCLIYNTAWFWTNNVYTANQMGSGYSGNNYAIFNGTGGVSATSPYNGGLTPNGMIGVGQAFIVQKKAVGTGTLQFKNSNGVGRNIRVSSPATFFQKENVDKNKFWLKLISPTQLVNSQLIGYVAGATDGYEQDFDAEAFGDFSDLFYSVLGNQKMVIQGRNEDFSADDKVDLGAIFFQNGIYTIEMGETEGIFAGAQKIYLKDKQLNMITDLSQGSYSFLATKGNNATRFEIIYNPETVLATESSVEEAVVVYRSGNDFVAKSSKKKITEIELYDTTGRLIYKKSPNGLTVVIPAEELVNTVYILKIDRSGEITTKKILR